MILRIMAEGVKCTSHHVRKNTYHTKYTMKIPNLFTYLYDVLTSKQHNKNLQNVDAAHFHTLTSLQ